MSARDAQPFGLVEVTAAELRPHDRVLLKAGSLHTVERIETRTFGRPGDPWYENDADGGRRLEVIYGPHHRCIHRLGDRLLIVAPVLRA